MLAVDLGGETIRALNGSMVAYEGQMAFKRQGMTGGEGLRGALKRRIAGEGMTLMEITGQGTVYLASEATEITLVQLQGEDALTDLLNERSRGGWEPAMMAQDAQRLTLVFAREVLPEG